MGQATYAIQHFLGGEVSQFAQGRFDKPDYRNSLNVCFNAFPVEIGTWARRPGTQFAGTTRGGSIGRVIEFDFQQSNAVTLEFTDGFLRFRSGVQLLDANDSQVVVAVSTANPAVVQTTSATNWATGNTLIFPGTAAPLLENRQFIATKIDTTHFSLADAITGVPLDGSALGALVAGAKVTRVQELATNYVAGAWGSIRAVQAETTDILLTAKVAPQALTVTTLPAPGVNPVFAIGQAVFNDGPYLDPFTNGVQAVPNQQTGIIQLTLSFPAYVATTAYPIGSFVTSASTNYVSLIDQNLGNTPASSPTAWKATAAGAAVNNGAGFLGTDIGRLVRLFAEPAAWVATASYVPGNTASYNPSGVPGASSYWQCITNSTGNVPGTDTTHWQLLTSNAAQWTWGKITGLLNFIPGNISGVSQIGLMTGNGGLGASFDGIVTKTSGASSRTASGILTLSGLGSSTDVVAYIGQNYSATAAGAYAVSSATVFPASDTGLATISTTSQFGANPILQFGGYVFLYGSNSAPSGPKDGTVLGITPIPQTTLNGPGVGYTYGNGFAPITVLSTDQTTTWKYVWMVIEPGVTMLNNGFSSASFGLNVYSAQVQVVAAGTASVTNSGVNVELLGPPLLYANAIKTWRLGAYSNTTGWPTCGAYHEGRLWLGGAIDNRFDACVSNGIVGSAINFAPTDQYGVVAASNAISYTLNSDGVNPIFWFQPDLQGIIIGTQAGEWLVQAPTNGPIAPANIAARRVTKVGCANVEPRRTDHTTVFAQRYGQKLMEYFPDVYSGKFSAPNLADKAQHITRAGIAELAYQSAVAPIIWGRDKLGALFGITYKRDTLTTSQGPTFYGWHRHALGSGRLVESICGGPSVGGGLDTLTMITNDPTTSVRHVELLTDAMDEATALTAAWFLDDAVRPTSTVSTSTTTGGAAPYGGLTLNGLWHLNGKTVTVFAGGLDCGDFAVASGSIFVPYGDSVSGGTGCGLFTAAYVASITPFPIVVGFTYNSDGQMVRPISIADTGARLGPALGDLRRNHRYSMLLSNTLGLSVGGSSFANMLPALLQQQNGAAIAALTTFSGIHQDSLKDDFSYDGMISWRVSRPYPANVVAISGNISTKDQ